MRATVNSRNAVSLFDLNYLGKTEQKSASPEIVELNLALIIFRIRKLLEFRADQTFANREGMILCDISRFTLNRIWSKCNERNTLIPVGGNKKTATL